MTKFETVAHINSKEFGDKLGGLYGEAGIVNQRARWLMLANQAIKIIPEGNVSLFSAPGRTELGGNHTDHNRGVILAAAVDLDTIAIVVPIDSTKISMLAEGYGSIDIDLHTLSVQQNEAGTSAALVRGVADFFVQGGFKIGGFSAVVQSTVLAGSGLSSSAAFEVLIGGIFNQLYNDGRADPVFIARAGQYAENQHFGKPCGLMDQAASALGGVVGIDFSNVAQPEIRKLAFDPDTTGHVLAVVNTGGSHADLTGDYASIPAEMKSVAVSLGSRELRDITFSQVMSNLIMLRAKVGDRAVLRALHFLSESTRAVHQYEALAQNDFQAFLCLVRASGASSQERLQNINPTLTDGNEQGIALAIALSKDFLQNDGAVRVHGGGFAGTIQVWVPSGRYDEYVRFMEAVFGVASVKRLRIRSEGVLCL